MPRGPLGGPRPFVRRKLEVNIFFSNRVDKDDVSIVRRISRSMFREIERVSGPHGQLQNVVSIGLTGTNQLSFNQMQELKEEIEQHKEIEDIEVIT